MIKTFAFSEYQLSEETIKIIKKEAKELDILCESKSGNFVVTGEKTALLELCEIMSDRAIEMEKFSRNCLYHLVRK